ncbi:unnamed protein product [Lactuca saligna]|uniref:Uncharacterized protein n=1 Tax=Lactuca saligna TaxID=75948 RepID=A0AA35VNI3_LACSI|nr:unnamed protein product [Lactuca saligna]
MFEIKEAIIEFEKSNEEFHELEESKVGEGFVKASTTPYPTILKKPEIQLLVAIDSKKISKYKHTNVIIYLSFLATIYAQISCREGAIDMIFGKHKLRLLLFGPTNDPPINGELFVINTIDDYVYEHTANMLYDTTHDLEKPLPCYRLIELNEIGCQQVKKNLWTTKHDVVLTHKSKMKVFNDTKHRVKKSSSKNYAWLFKSRFKHHCGKIKGKMVYLYKVKECIPRGLIP